MYFRFCPLTVLLSEGVHVYNVTLVRQGEPEGNIPVSIHPSPDPIAVDTVECKRMAKFI